MLRLLLLTAFLRQLAATSGSNDCPRIPVSSQNDFVQMLQLQAPVGVTWEAAHLEESDDGLVRDMAPLVDQTLPMREWGSEPPKSDDGWWDKSGEIWKSIQHARRHRWNPAKHAKTKAGDLFLSVHSKEWFLFLAAFISFVPLQRYLLNGPDTTKAHIISLMLWLSLGGVFNMLLWLRSGPKNASMWLTGYLLEFLFSFENVFVFHAVVRAFRMSDRLTKHMLFIVSLCQVAFEMVFFMGIARTVKSWSLLPYILGAWLVYVGILAALEDRQEKAEPEDTWAYYLSHLCCGSRLLPASSHPADTERWFLFKEGKTYVSLLVPLTCWLLAVDFLLEIDVVLTKIEELPNHYISFTSSAMASFAMVPLFFVAGDLFQQFVLLRFAVSFALLFFGGQMLLHRFVAVSPLEAIGAVLAIFVLCMALSPCCPEASYPKSAEDDSTAIHGSREPREGDVPRSAAAALEEE